jgi:Leucine-rich repeat (LRR) protein
MGEEDEAEEGEQPWTPTEEDISNALSVLAKTADGTSVAYTKFDLRGQPGRCIAELDVSIAEKMLQHVRHLDVANNKLILDISPALEQMGFLLSVKASGNSIMAFESNSGPLALPFLQTIDLSNNKLTSWVGVESPNLRYLNLSNNEISAIAGLQHNPELQMLLLADNKPLKSCDGLGLSSLHELSLTGCGLESVGGLSTLALPSKTLDLTDNALQNLAGLPPAGALSKLVLAGNPSLNLDAFDALAEVGLRELTLPEIEDAPGDLRVQMIKKLAKDKDKVTLCSLNGAAITPEEIEQVDPSR